MRRRLCDRRRQFLKFRPPMLLFDQPIPNQARKLISAKPSFGPASHLASGLQCQTNTPMYRVNVATVVAEDACGWDISFQFSRMNDAVVVSEQGIPLLRWLPHAIN